MGQKNKYIIIFCINLFINLIWKNVQNVKFNL